MIPLLLMFLMACGTTTVDVSKDCDLRMGPIAPASGPAGSLVQAKIDPATTVWDTAIYVGGERAEVTEIGREGCEECDTCKEEAGCLECSDCDTCDAICQADCSESVTFTIPDLTAGVADVVLYNSHGSSNKETFTVSATTDTGASDSGSDVDSGSTESTDTADTSSDDTGD